jgi:hypothetical protein
MKIRSSKSIKIFKDRANIINNPMGQDRTKLESGKPNRHKG